MAVRAEPLADQAAKKIQEAAARVAAEAEPAADKAADKLVATGKDISAKGPKVRVGIEPHWVHVCAAAQFVMQLQSLNFCPQMAGTPFLSDASEILHALLPAALHAAAAGAARHSCLHNPDLNHVQWNP